MSSLAGPDQLRRLIDAVLTVGSELDLATVSRFEAALGRVSGSVRLIVDLTECSFLDSSAVRVLLARAAEDTASTLTVVAPDAGVRKVLEIAGLDTKLPIYPTVAEAL